MKTQNKNIDMKRGGRANALQQVIPDSDTMM